MAYENTQKMLSANATAAINTTTDVTGTATECNVKDDQYGTIYLYVKGDNAACAEDLTFTFQRSPDNGTTWFDLDTITVTLNGTSQVVNADTNIDCDFRMTRFIRMKSVANAETVAGRTATVNAYLQRKN